jgi:hypothetical protein
VEGVKPFESEGDRVEARQSTPWTGVDWLEKAVDEYDSYGLSLHQFHFRTRIGEKPSPSRSLSACVMHLKSIDYPGGKAKHVVWERAEYYGQTCESDSIKTFERKDSTRHDGKIHSDREMKYLG